MRLAQERADMELAVRLESEQAAQDAQQAKNAAPQGVEPQQPEVIEETVGALPAREDFEDLDLA